MRSFSTDLHIHTVLSPCGDLSMSPSNIVERAAAIGLELIAITDHNSTLHGPTVRKIAEEKGIMVLYGAEVTTKEDVHCLCLFENEKQRILIQNFLDENRPEIKNNPDLFGHQVLVDEQEEIIEEVEPLLISGINASIDEIEKIVHQIGGLFIPAHIDRPKYSIMSQLGFIPKDLKYDALEISKNTSMDTIFKNYSYIKNARFIKSSDAHTLNQIGTSKMFLRMNNLSWNEFKMAILGIEGREIILS
ncbi:MAG: PHP domain-containing protein [Bacteroidales bacterium]|nr:PHP domain-containing protein [Bacteroidales bacterium]